MEDLQPCTQALIALLEQADKAAAGSDREERWNQVCAKLSPSVEEFLYGGESRKPSLKERLFGNKTPNSQGARTPVSVLPLHYHVPNMSVSFSVSAL